MPTISDPPSTADMDMVRLLIPDTDAARQLFTDSQITSFLTLEGGNVKLAAAQALDVAASSEVMVSKVIRTLDLQTDGAKVSAELRARAAALRAQDAAAVAAEDTFAFDVVDMVPGSWYELTEYPEA